MASILNENNCVQVIKGDKMGLNFNLLPIIPAKYDFVAMPSDGLVLVQDNDQYAYFDALGIVLPFSNKYEYYGDFNDGLAPIRLNGKYGFIDKRGELVIKPLFHFVDGFKEGLCIVRNENDLYGAINKNGEFIIPNEYNYMGKFKNGYAQIGSYPNNVGIINSKGNIIIKQEYYSIEYINDETFKVVKKENSILTEGTLKLGQPVVWNNNYDAYNSYLAKHKDFVRATEELINKLYNNGCPCEHPRFRDYIVWTRSIEFVDQQNLFFAFRKHLNKISDDGTKTSFECPVCHTIYDTEWKEYSIAMQITEVEIRAIKQFNNNYKTPDKLKPFCLTFRGYSDMSFIAKEYYNTDITTVINYLSE